MRRPEPLASRTAATFLAAVAVRAAVQRGWLGPGIDTAGEQVLADALVSAGGALVMWWWSRGKVTPTDDPRSTSGVPLVPVTRARQLGDSPDLEDLGRVLHRRIVAELTAVLSGQAAAGRPPPPSSSGTRPAQ